MSLRQLSLFALVFIGFVASSQTWAAVLASSNATWKVIPSNPGAVPWNTDPAFNDSGWQNATVLGDVDSYVADTIWSSGGQFGNEPLVWVQLDGEFLSVTPPGGSTAIPTLSEWGLLMLALLVGGYGLYRVRRLN